MQGQQKFFKNLYQRRAFLHRSIIAGIYATLAACRLRENENKDHSLKIPASDQFDNQNAPDDANRLLDFYTKDTDIKRQARADYAQSLVQFGGKLSLNLSELKDSYDVVVIGSGYGASILAARIAEQLGTGKTICILERGKEWISGDFPDNVSGFRKELRSALNPTGLFDINIYRDLATIQANGLGGTSLINANVAARPTQDAFNNQNWPTPLRNFSFLENYYKRAESMLAPSPTNVQSSGKIAIQSFVSKKIDQAIFTPLPVTIQSPASAANEARTNDQGMIQRGCTSCGDCMSGCNVGAKNTLPYNYLRLAKKHACKMFCEIEVDFIEKQTDGYVVHANSDSERSWFGRLLFGSKKPHSIKAKLVVVGAGSPGSAAILLRSKENGLKLSSKIGHGFSTNGDFLGIVKGVDKSDTGIKLDIAGKGAYDKQNSIGPSIQSAIEYKRSSEMGNRFVIEDLSVPRAVFPLLRLLTGSAEKAMFCLGVGFDGEAGSIRLNNGKVTIEWPTLARLPIFGSMRSAMGEYARVLKASSGKMFELIGKEKPIAAHPLGGCRLANSPDLGVCNFKGQVFTGENLDTHHGLYVADASVVPSSLGINPFLTISALAEFIAEQLVAERSLETLFVQ